MVDDCGNKSTEWNKEKEPKFCDDCGSKACAQADIGRGIHWYCFACIMENSQDVEYESDESLEVCQEQLQIQSEIY